MNSLANVGKAEKPCVQKREKEHFLNIIDILDWKAEKALLCRDKEFKRKQRAKVRNVKEGGNNTKYLHLFANSKHMRNNIFQLEKDEGTIVLVKKI
jgi:hypothetical protein